MAHFVRAPELDYPLADLKALSVPSTECAKGTVEWCPPHLRIPFENQVLSRLVSVFRVRVHKYRTRLELKMLCVCVCVCYRFVKRARIYCYKHQALPGICRKRHTELSIPSITRNDLANRGTIPLKIVAAVVEATEDMM
jgi:hypothetical protein